MNNSPKKILRRKGGPGLPIILTLPDLHDRIDDLHGTACDFMPDFSVISIDWPDLSKHSPIGRETSISALGRHVRDEIAFNPGVPLYSIARGGHGSDLLYGLMQYEPDLYRNNILICSHDTPASGRTVQLQGNRVLLCGSGGQQQSAPKAIEDFADCLRKQGARVDTYLSPQNTSPQETEQRALMAFFA